MPPHSKLALLNSRSGAGNYAFRLGYGGVPSIFREHSFPFLKVGKFFSRQSSLEVKEQGRLPGFLSCDLESEYCVWPSSVWVARTLNLLESIPGSPFLLNPQCDLTKTKKWTTRGMYLSPTGCNRGSSLAFSTGSHEYTPRAMTRLGRYSAGKVMLGLGSYVACSWVSTRWAPIHSQ